MTREPLPASSPSAEGIAPKGIEGFLDALEAAPGVEPHSLMILRHDRLVASGWWWPYAPERPHLLYSLSKTFTASALALAVGEGLLQLDDPVIGYFPELDAHVTDRRTRATSVRHLAAMSSGHRFDTWEQVVATAPEDPVRAFLTLPPEAEPGTVFCYNQSCTYTLARLLQRLTGTTLTSYLRPRFLDPLGIGPVSWGQHPAGQDLGFTGLHAPTDAVARLGWCYLRDGALQGRQVLPVGWVAEASRLQVRTEDSLQAQPASPDWAQGYGFQLWRSRHGFRGDGAYGQLCLVLPEEDAVVALTAESTDTQAVLDAAWEHLLPAFSGDEGPLDEVGDAALAERLAHLELPVPPARPTPLGDPERWVATPFLPAGGSCAAQPSLEEVRLERGEGGWQMTLDEGRLHLVLPLGGRWSERATALAEGGVLPTASCGGWLDERSCRLECAFLETPHRLVVTCSLDERSFAAEWVTAPLRQRHLDGLRAPASGDAVR